MAVVTWASVAIRRLGQDYLIHKISEGLLVAGEDPDLGAGGDGVGAYVDGGVDGGIDGYGFLLCWDSSLFLEI